MLAASRHQPNAALQVISRLARAAPPAERAQLERLRRRLQRDAGPAASASAACPSRCRTRRHASRFLIAWLLLLPFGCWTAMGWDALLFAPLTAFLLFSVDQIGIKLEFIPCCRWMCWPTS
jgi:hypothetical protein